MNGLTREEKIKRYIESVIEGMDWKTMYHYVYESIEESLKGDTDEQIDEMASATVVAESMPPDCRR
jgi:hypothetical protein